MADQNPCCRAGLHHAFHASGAPVTTRPPWSAAELAAVMAHAVHETIDGEGTHRAATRAWWTKVARAVLDEYQLRRGLEACCDEACNGGACESCRCCAAGWCVTGADGMPPDPGDMAGWIEVAREHNPVVAAWATDRAELGRLRTRVAELEAEQLSMEQRHRVALARELTAAAGCPLRDRYGFAAYDSDIVTVLEAVFAHPDDEAAVSAIFAANWSGEIELAMHPDTPTDEEYERRIVAALRPLVEDRRNAAGRGLS